MVGSPKRSRSEIGSTKNLSTTTEWLVSTMALMFAIIKALSTKPDTANRFDQQKQNRTDWNVEHKNISLVRDLDRNGRKDSMTSTANPHLS